VFRGLQQAVIYKAISEQRKHLLACICTSDGHFEHLA